MTFCSTCEARSTIWLWQLLILDGQIPDPEQKPQFPIYDTATNQNGNPRNVTIQPGIRRQDITDALIKIQPYTILAKFGHPTWDQSLWALTTLNNADKHRLLLSVVHRVQFQGRNGPYWFGEKVTSGTSRRDLCKRTT